MRREAFVSTALAAAVTAPAFAQTTALQTVHVSGTGADDVAPLLYGQKSGLFRAAGLDPTFERSNSGSATIAAVVGGSVDIGKSSMGSIITARAKNIGDLKIHSAGATFRSVKGDVMLVVSPDSPIRAAKDLNGKTIAVPSLGDQNTLAVRAWSDANGGDSRSISFLEMPSSAGAAAVQQGRVAAAALVPPFVAHAVGSGVVRVMANVFAAIAPRFLETGWFTTSDYAAKHRDVVLPFGKIMSTASAYVNAHTVETATALSAFSGVPAASIIDTGISYFSTSVDPRDIQPLIDAMAKYGLIDHRFDAADFLFK
jgi:NitT/TauT family transport system substrate-binding protein